ncbi:MAG: DNA-binding protein [Salinisphaera sp.]|jgi:chromosome segregation ATPase|nr:DNA-binding protein [Salinisphaera sp.]
MTRTNLDPQQAVDAMRDIMASGAYPSMNKVRTALDTTASQQTLSGVMHSAWKLIADQLGTGVPEGLPPLVADAARRIYDEVRDVAREDLEAHKAEVAEREALLNALLITATEVLETAQSQIGYLHDRIEVAKSENQSLVEQRDECAAERSQAESRNKDLDNELRTARAEMAAVLRRLRHDQRHAIAARDAEVAQHKTAVVVEQRRAEEQQQWWAQRVDEARQATLSAEKTAEEKEAALVAKLDATSSQLVDMRDAWNEQRRENTGLVAANQALQAHETQLTAELGHMRQQADTLRSERDDLRATANQENNQARQELARAASQASERLRTIQTLEAWRAVPMEDREPPDERSP